MALFVGLVMGAGAMLCTQQAAAKTTGTGSTNDMPISTVAKTLVKCVDKCVEESNKTCGTHLKPSGAGDTEEDHCEVLFIKQDFSEDSSGADQLEETLYQKCNDQFPVQAAEEVLDELTDQVLVQELD